MINDHVRAIGAYDAAQDPSDLFNICLHDGDIQAFDMRWDQALLAASAIPTKLQDSVQLQTVLALYEQETIRNSGQPSFSRLKTTVRRKTDQTMRTRNFRVRNELAERGTVTKNQKRERSLR